MSVKTRRDFLRTSLFGLAAAAAGGPLVLTAGAQPTPALGEDHGYPQTLRGRIDGGLLPRERLSWEGGGSPTLPNVQGPFYREGVPFRGKVTPPFEAGTPMVINGRVWSYGTGLPLPFAVVDIWQANSEGRYDNDDPFNPPAKGVFRNRCSIIADQTGYYEYETIHPGPYQTGPNTWRPNHIHYMVRYPAHKTLITQLYFRGDPHQAGDPFIRDSLIIDLAGIPAGGQFYEAGTFDIVLAPEYLDR